MLLRVRREMKAVGYPASVMAGYRAVGSPSQDPTITQPQR